MLPTCQARGRRTRPPGSQEPPASESRGQPVTVQGADTPCPETLSLQVQEGPSVPLLLGPATSENVWARDSEPGTPAGPATPGNQIPTADCKCFGGEGKDGSVPFIILRGPQLSKMVMSHRSELKPRVLQGHKGRSRGQL